MRSPSLKGFNKKSSETMGKSYFGQHSVFMQQMIHVLKQLPTKPTQQTYTLTPKRGSRPTGQSALLILGLSLPVISVCIAATQIVYF